MIQVLISLSESAYKEMCENGIDNVDYDIRQMMKNAVVIKRSLCDSCVTKGYQPYRSWGNAESEYKE